MYCKYCGKQITDDSIFCQYCGGKVDLKKSEYNYTEPLVKEITSSTHLNSPTIKVVLEKPKTNTEEKARNATKRVLRELAVLTIIIIFAFFSGVIGYFIVHSTPIPEVTEEEQQAFNDAILEKEKENPYEISFGLDAAKYLKLGDFKYDNDISVMSELNNITDTRNALLDINSKEIGRNVFWIVLISLAFCRYLYMFSRWILKGNQTTFSNNINDSYEQPNHSIPSTITPKIGIKRGDKVRHTTYYTDRVMIVGEINYDGSCICLNEKGESFGTFSVDKLIKI